MLKHRVHTRPVSIGPPTTCKPGAGDAKMSWRTAPWNRFSTILLRFVPTETIALLTSSMISLNRNLFIDLNHILSSCNSKLCLLFFICLLVNLFILFIFIYLFLLTYLYGLYFFTVPFCAHIKHFSPNLE